MPTTVGKLATSLGLHKEQVLDACKRTGVTAWSEHTPLDDGETDRVLAVLGAAPGAGAAAPGAARPGPPATGAPGGPPLPPPPGYAAGPFGAPAHLPPAYGGPGFPVAPPRRKRRGLVVAGALAAGLVGAGIVGAASSEDAPSNEEEAGLELVVGDCWDDRTDPEATALVVEAFLAEKPCAEPHDAEVFAVFDHPAVAGSPYPGDAAVSAFADSECAGRFAAFVGIAYEGSELDVVSIFPQALGWERLDQREIACSVIDFVPGGEEPQQLTGTMQGAAR